MPLSTFALWFLLVWGTGWLFFPISRRIFGDILPDGGLAVGRVLFLTAWTLAAFWAGYAGVSTQISALLWIPLALIGIVVERRDSKALHREMRARKRAIFAGETIFVGVFLLFFVLRGFWSDTSGTNGEKSMDGALIASLSRAQKLPPPNPFSAGATLNSYYYFGHLETALLTNATGSSMRWTYNLMCATLPALCFSTLFSLGAALTGRLRGGAFVVGAVLVLGTLEPIVQWLHPENFGPSTFFRLDHFATSRVIPFTINEFPWFTFHQADLHAHYFDFPLALATMCLALALFRGSQAALVPATLILGAQILTNTWDFPVYGLLLGLAVLVGTWHAMSAVSAGDDACLSAMPSKDMACHVPTKVRIGWAFLLLLGALLVASPYLLHLKTAATPPKPLHQPASPLREWLLLWGPMALAWGAFLWFTAGRKKLVLQVGFVVLCVLVWNLALSGAWAAPSGLVLPLIVVLLLLSSWGAARWRGDARFLCLLALCGLVALLWAETTWAGFLGSADNPGSDDYKRQDTVFKFGLQTWMLWGTAASCGAYLTLRKWPIALKAAWIPALLVMLIASFAVVGGRTRNFSSWDGWDGWAHLAPPEKDAAHWLLQHTARGENLLEAEAKEGGDYTPLPRYAPATGIPTVMGPQAHSFQWSPANSGAIDVEWREVSRRKERARAIYLSPDPEMRRLLLNRYDVRFIVFGELEETEYGLGALENLHRDLKVAKQFGAQDDPRRVLIFEDKK